MFKLQDGKARSSANASLKHHKGIPAYTRAQEEHSKKATQMEEYDDLKWQEFWMANMKKNLH